jgi:hypothetical protein
MLVLLLTIAVIAIAMAAMAVGVAVSGRRLKGSCGGVEGDCHCDVTNCRSPKKAAKPALEEIAP